MNVYYCPKTIETEQRCGGRLQYSINIDQYSCVKCHEHYDVLDVEQDHVLYAAPKEVTP